MVLRYNGFRIINLFLFAHVFYICDFIKKQILNSKMWIYIIKYIWKTLLLEVYFWSICKYEVRCERRCKWFRYMYLNDLMGQTKAIVNNIEARKWLYILQKQLCRYVDKTITFTYYLKISFERHETYTYKIDRWKFQLYLDRL